MKSNKYLFKVLVLMVILLSGSCSEEFITKPIQPGTESDASFRKTADGLSYTLNASYAPLAGNYWYQYYLSRLIMGNDRSDDIQAGGEDENDDMPAHALNDFNIFSTNGNFLDFWRHCYIGVHYANAVIEFAPTAIPVAKPEDVARINNYVGEAKCLRAYWYFQLVRNYGDVPLLLSSTSQSLIPRTNRLLVYDQIQQDLTEASLVLKPANALLARDKGRMNSGSALAILAKVYLFRASLETDKADQYYNLAYETAKKVIDSGQFNLLPAYNTNWTLAADFSSEGIIEGGQPAINNADIGYGPVYTAPRYYYTGKKTADGLNIKGPSSAYGWGFCTPTQDLVDAFEPGDPRKNWTVFVQGDSCNVGVTNKNTMQLICFDHSMTGYYLRKQVPNGYPKITDNVMNVKYYRYSDLLLVGAEAANEIGKTTEALAWLEKVRFRARNTPAAPNHKADKIAGAPVKITETNKDLLRIILQHERRVELGVEDNRYYDLVRWDGKNGIDWTAIVEAGQRKIGPNFQIDSDEKSGKPRSPHIVLVESKHKLSPIPDADIKTSGNTLTQNEGY
ncbi:MAG: RagB/SusD family nutrient uptake outer membrane protein [Bacteroidia bacterium]|jgi:starch-binding outer membrane protein, SusD/RagB family